MNNQPPIQNQTGYFDKKSKVVTAVSALLLVTFLICLAAYVTIFDVFKPEPKVEIVAQNNFTKTLHVVTDIDYEPYSYVDANGSYSGLDVEMINEIANRLQMNLDLKLMSWTDAKKAFREGKADIIMNMESDLISNNSNFIATLPTTETVRRLRQARNNFRC